MMVGLTPLGDLLSSVGQRPSLDQFFDVGSVIAPEDESVIVLLVHQITRHAIFVHPGT